MNLPLSEELIAEANARETVVIDRPSVRARVLMVDMKWFSKSFWKSSRIVNSVKCIFQIASAAALSSADDCGRVAKDGLARRSCARPARLRRGGDNEDCCGLDA